MARGAQLIDAPAEQKQPVAPPHFGKWLPLAGLTVVLAAGAYFRAYELGQECFDCDELYAVRIQGTSWKTLGAVVGRDAFHTNHPPLMNVPFLYWAAAFGPGEASVRALPLLLGLVGVVLIYLLGTRLAGWRVGLLAAAALALNPLHVAYSREARHYAMLVVLLLGAHLFFLRALERGRGTDRAGYFAFALLAIFTHYFAVPALAAHAVLAGWIAVRGEPAARRAALQALLTLALAAVPFVAWVPIILHQSKVRWGHLREGTFVNMGLCLQEMAGVGAGPLLLVTVATAVLLLLVAAGLWGSRGHGLTLDCADDRPPLPRWAGPLVIAGGLLTAALLFWLTPIAVLPSAGSILETYGYDQDVIADELAKLYRLLVTFPCCVAAVGVLLVAWPRLLAVLERLPRARTPSRRPLSVAAFVGACLVVPLVLVRCGGILNMPFVSGRNLLIVVGPLDLALALGLAALAASRAGRLLAAGAVGLLLAAGLQYDPLAAPLGGTGQELGIHTGPWRDLAAGLGSLPDGPRPLLAARSADTDPVLYYLPDYHPRRIRAAADLTAHDSPARFWFVHLSSDADSARVLADLARQPGTMKPVLEVGPFVVYDVERSGG
jgi:4-amino-4-deoxy-L-arabinose transferase-like glycosyltransferase